MATTPTALERVVRRDRIVVLASLVALTALAWSYLVDMARGMDMAGAMGAAMAMAVRPWDLGHFAAMFVMWAIMMVGMMLPSAAPMILLFAALERRGQATRNPHPRVVAFVAGYLLVWTGFGLAATALQWGLAEAALLSPTMMTTSPVLVAALFALAGIWQLTPLKHVCLRHCRAPAQFLAAHARPGVAGALHTGVAHGAYCVGCCWFLMGLLFVGGVMNLLWVAAIAVFVLAEKVVPRGELLARASGAAMFMAALWLLLRPSVPM